MFASTPSDSPGCGRSRWPQFDLPLLFEIVAGAALAVALVVELGPLGAGILVVAVYVLFVIAFVCNGWLKRKFSSVEIVVVVVIGAMLAALLLPVAHIGYSRTTACRSNLRNFGLALSAYHVKHGCYPPAVVNDAAGNPMHGWQVFLQPLLERVSFFERYDLNQSWDGPTNASIAAIDTDYAACASMAGKPGATSYFVVTGRGRWADNVAPRLKDMPDGPEQTILVVETHMVAIAWTQPRPLTVDEFLELARSEKLSVHKYQRHDWAPWRDGVHVLMADGEMRVLRADLDQRTWRALLTPAGGETIDLDRFVISLELPVLRMLLLTAVYVLIITWRHWPPGHARAAA